STRSSRPCATPVATCATSTRKPRAAASRSTSSSADCRSGACAATREGLAAMAAPTVAAPAPLLQGQHIVEEGGGGDCGAGAGALDHQRLGGVAVRPEGDAVVGPTP